MSNSIHGDNFVEEEAIESQLYHEDLSEDDELWLIRMPPSIELSQLDRKKIFLSDNTGNQNIKNIKTENGMLLECLSENCEIPNLNVVLPQKSDKKLRAVNKKFKGTILISVEGNNGIKSEMENELKVKSENELQEDTSSANEGKKRKKKKKQHLNLSENSDVNYNTEDSESISSSSKKKHGKRKSDISENMSLGVKIENELFSMDLDSFPMCNSQKK